MGDLALAAGRPVFDAIDAELLGRMSPGALILHDNWSMQDEASPARQRSCAPAVQLRVGPLQDVSFTRDKFSELKLKNLRLWWPQGYGQQPLYRLAVVASSGGAPSYRAEIYFGVRKLGYFCRPAEYAHTLVPIPDGAWPYD
jgi:hypothetical protein